MNVKHQVINRLHDTKFLLECIQYFNNWSEIYSAYQKGVLLPTLITRTKNKPIFINHEIGDDPITLFKEIFVWNCYTPQEFYQPSSEDVVIDLGANIGIFMLYLTHQAPKIQVHCFEPCTKTRNCLESQVTANHLSDRVRIYPYAVSNQTGSATLKFAQNSGHQSLYDSEFVDSIGEIVETISLQGVLEKCDVTTVDLLKIDVEGAEIEIVEGMPTELWTRIRRVVCEYHDLLRPGCRERVARCLTTNGFQVHIAPPISDLGLIYATRE